MKYCVIGLGASGLAASRVLVEQGHEVTGIDDRRQAVEAALDALCGSFEAVETDHCEAAIENADIIVASPGIAPSHRAYRMASRACGELIGEVELAWRLQHDVYGKDTPWLAVTGTNGKTTTVGMAVSMAEAAGLRALAVGNIGVPVVEAISKDADVYVVEMSSFQLHTLSTASPLASVCLNVASDHVDWHGSTEAYIADKARIYRNVRAAAIYNAADAQTLRMVEEADVCEGARAIGITLGVPGLSQLGIVDNLLVDRAYGDNRRRQAIELASFADFDHLGGATAALLSDALAAAALVRCLGVEPDAVSRGLRAFSSAPHRRAVVGTKAQLTWIDDSKATNAHAACATLESMPEKSVIWIVGGDAKGQDLHALVESVRPVLRAAIVIGKDQSAVTEAFEDKAPDVARVHIADMRPGETLQTLMTEVVHEAVALSVPGNTVVLAPACASWDQFDNYGQRGDLFASTVMSLE